jgi:hypothetical protein
MNAREQRTAAMTITHLIPILAFSFWIVPAGGQMLASRLSGSDAIAGVGSAQQTSPDLRGTWSGTFISKNSDISPFTITVKINQDPGGHLVGDASLVSDCLKSHRLYVRISDSNVELAGSDADGDIVAFSGTVDNTGTMLKLNYIINGSRSGSCEIDDGTGTMAKL